jgi:hypothetical protein
MPVYSYVMIALFVGLVIFMKVRGKAMTANHEAENSQYRLGSLAQRLGMAIVEGDPMFNLFVTNRWQDLGQATSKVGWSPTIDRPEIRVRLAGSPYGHPAELTYYDRLETQDKILERVVKRWFDARLSVATTAAFPDFELVLRTPGQYVEPTEQFALPAQSLGDATLDRQFRLKCADARLGPAIAPVLGPFMPLGYVHVVGQGGKIAFVMTEYGMPVALYSIEAVLLVLESMACVFEGRPPPGAYAPRTV